MTSDSFSPRVSWSRVALSRSDANWANAASARYWARSSLSGAGDLLHRLGLGGRADARHRDADVQGGPLAGVEQVGLEEDLAVGDRDDVGRDVGRHVVGLRLDDRQGRQRAAAVLLVEARGALEQAAVEVEDVARVRLAAGRAAEQERHLAVRPGVLGQVVVDAQRVLDRAWPSTSTPFSMTSSPIATPEYGARYWSGAGSSAPATTTMVCSIAPYCSSDRRRSWRRSTASGRWRRRCRRGPCPSG